MPVDLQVRARETVTSEPRSGPRPVELFLDTPEKNAELVDGRDQTPIPIVSGEHTDVTLRPDEVVGMDISSLMVLSHLSLLREALSTFKHIVVAPDFESQLQGEKDGNYTNVYPSVLDWAWKVVGAVLRCRIALVWA